MSGPVEAEPSPIRIDRPPGTTVPGNRWDLVADREAGPVEVSVIVTHFEQPAELARTMHALTRQTHPAELTEVIVVDDGSTNAPTVPAGARLLRQADLGFRAAAARNLGARHATGRVLAFLDADTTPEPDYLARISRLPALLPEAVVVGRRRHAALSGVGPEEPVQVAGPAHELSEPAWLGEGYAASRDLLDADDLSFRYVISAVAACTRWFHAEIGGFDETFEAYGGEDWEWAHRAWAAGGLLAHEPRAVAWHDGPDRGAREAGGQAALRAETLAIARRIGVAGVRARGLLLGAPEVVVDLVDGIGPEHLVITLDGLLEALPHTRVLLRADQAAGVPGLTRDPRVVVADLPSPLTDPLTGPLTHLRLHRGVRAPVARWRSMVDRVRGEDLLGGLSVAAADGPLLEARDLRAVRRAARWSRDDLFEHVSEPPDGFEELTARSTVQAHLGGWG